MTNDALTELETYLRSLLKGEFVSLHLSFNDRGAPSYMTVAQVENEAPQWAPKWVSEDEKARGVETNSCWELQWYPDTPIGSYSMAASSLPALVAAVKAEFP
jgi:hypothetical protein